MSYSPEEAPAFTVQKVMNHHVKKKIKENPRSTQYLLSLVKGILLKLHNQLFHL